MASGERKGINQKLKMLYLLRLFEEETDENHALTLGDIIDRLEEYGVNVERKTLYQDLEELRRFGVDIVSEKQGVSVYYRLGARDFELPELKLLVDAVQASRFITSRKSAELIRKLEGLASHYEAGSLRRQVTIAGRIKTMNESIYYNVDRIHRAVNAGIQIRFKYAQWNLDKKLVPRRNGSTYQVSPWALTWDNENYYMIAYDKKADQIKHYRVDKMQYISETDEPREGEQRFRAFNLPSYANSLFRMFGGEPTEVTLEADNEMVGVLIDRFGRKIPIKPMDAEHFQTVVSAAVSPQFLGWVMGLGGRVRIVGPLSVVERMKNEVHILMSQYGVRP